MGVTDVNINIDRSNMKLKVNVILLSYSFEDSVQPALVKMKFHLVNLSPSRADDNHFLHVTSFNTSRSDQRSLTVLTNFTGIEQITEKFHQVMSALRPENPDHNLFPFLLEQINVIAVSEQSFSPFLDELITQSWAATLEDFASAVSVKLT